MSERQRFHPLALTVYLFSGIKTWLFLIVLVLINGDWKTAFGKITILLILLFVAVQSIWNYFSETYQISPEKIIIYQGVLRKREIDIPYGRIQTIKQRQWFFFRPFNVTQLLIETAGGEGADAEASMPAVNIELLEKIEEYREGKSGDQKKETNEDQDQLSESNTNYRVSSGQIVLFGLTNLSVIATLIAVPAFIGEFIPETWAAEATSVAVQVWRAGSVFTILAIVFILFTLILISLAKTFFQYYNFKVTRHNQTLSIEKGLFERHTQKIPVDKIQGIKIRQQPLRRLFKLSSVELLLAGGQEQDGDSGLMKKIYILPIISDQKLYETLDSILPEWQFKSPEINYISRNKLWFFLRWKLLLLLIAVGLGFVNRWLMFIVLSIAVLLLLDGFFEAYFQGYAIQSNHRVCVQTIENFSKVQSFVERPKVQSFSEHTTKWLESKEIGHVKLFLKSGLEVDVLQLKFMNFRAIQPLKEFYLNKT